MHTKPFIHLIESVKSKAFFDVNTNALVRVSDEIYTRLQELMSPWEIGEGYKGDPLLRPLLREGYLSDKRVEKIEHPMTKYLENGLDRSLRSMALQVTQGCNLRCEYCAYTNSRAQRSHSGKTMTFETAKAAVDFLMAHSADTETLNIGFYGGEPLLRQGLIERVLGYVKNEYAEKDVTYNITTNATLIAERTLELFAEYKLDVLISLDGPEEIHNINRCYAADGVGSFADVKRSIERITRWNKTRENKVKFNVNMVTDQRLAFDDWSRVYDEVPDLEGVDITTSLVNPTFLSKEYSMSAEFGDGYYYGRFLALLEYFGYVKGLRVMPFMKSMVGADISKAKMASERKMNSLPDVTAHSGPCVPGKSRLLVDADGSMFPCERVSETSEALKIGDVWSGFDMEKCDALLNIGRLTVKECRDCWAIRRCEMCAKSADDGNKLSAAEKLTHCETMKNNVHEFLKMELLMQDLRAFEKKRNRYKKGESLV